MTYVMKINFKLIKNKIKSINQTANKINNSLNILSIKLYFSYILTASLILAKGLMQTEHIATKNDKTD